MYIVQYTIRHVYHLSKKKLILFLLTLYHSSQIAYYTVESGYSDIIIDRRPKIVVISRLSLNNRRRYYRILLYIIEMSLVKCFTELTMRQFKEKLFVSLESLALLHTKY